jgi:PAS domain S-box-containing protein
MLRTVSDAVGAAHASTEPYMVTAACPPHAITYANPAWLELFGWSAAELARQTVKILHGPQTSRKELAALEVALASKQPACAQLTLYDRHGETTACTVIAEPLLDPSRQLVTHHAHLIRSAVATAAQSSAASLAAAQAQAQAQTDAHAHARAMATAAAVSDSWRLGAAFAASDAATDAILGAELDRLLPTILTGGGSGECSDGGGGHELIRPSSFASMLGANAAIELAGGLSAWLNAADVAPAPSGGASPAAPPSASAARAHGGGGGGSGLGRLGAFGGQLASSSQQQLEEHTRLQLLQRQLEASMHASETSAEPRPLFKVIVNVDSSVFRMPLTLEAALQPSADMIVVTEALPPYRIVHVNSAWSRTCGWTAEQAVGQVSRPPGARACARRVLARVGRDAQARRARAIRERACLRVCSCSFPSAAPSLPACLPLAPSSFLSSFLSPPARADMPHPAGRRHLPRRAAQA